MRPDRSTNGRLSEQGLGLPGRAQRHIDHRGRRLYAQAIGVKLLAALARPQEPDVPGVRLALRPEFDVSLETAPRDGIELGTILDRTLNPAGPFTLPPGSLHRHVFVCGAIGARKSQTVRSFIEGGHPLDFTWLLRKNVVPRSRWLGRASVIPYEQTITIDVCHPAESLEDRHFYLLQTGSPADVPRYRQSRSLLWGNTEER